MTIPHPHLWRRMTPKEDYGKFGPHFGEYKGYAEEICRICGVTRKCQSWQAWRYELDDAEKRVQHLISTEPTREPSPSGLTSRSATIK